MSATWNITEVACDWKSSSLPLNPWLSGNLLCVFKRMKKDHTLSQFSICGISLRAIQSICRTTFPAMRYNPEIRY